MKRPDRKAWAATATGESAAWDGAASMLLAMADHLIELVGDGEIDRLHGSRLIKIYVGMADVMHGDRATRCDREADLFRAWRGNLAEIREDRK